MPKVLDCKKPPPWRRMTIRLRDDQTRRCSAADVPLAVPQSGLTLISDEREVALPPAGSSRCLAGDARTEGGGDDARQVHVSDHLGFQAVRKAK